MEHKNLKIKKSTVHLHLEFAKCKGCQYKRILRYMNCLWPNDSFYMIYTCISSYTAMYFTSMILTTSINSMFCVYMCKSRHSLCSILYLECQVYQWCFQWVVSCCAILDALIDLCFVMLITCTIVPFANILWLTLI